MHIPLLCDTCGSNSHFMSNDDCTYIKCTLCNREYFGGREELVELNSSNINLALEKKKQEITKMFIKQIKF